MDQLIHIQQDLQCGTCDLQYLEVLAQLIKSPQHTLSWWNQCLNIIESSVINEDTIRTYRAVLILTKMLTVNDFKNNGKDILLIINQLNRFLQKSSTLESNWNDSIISQFCEILANLSHYDVDNVNDIIIAFNNIECLQKLPKNPTIVFITKLILKSHVEGIDNNPYATGVNITYQKLFELSPLLSLLCDYFDKIDFENLTSYDLMLIECLQAAIADESFGKWLISNSDNLHWLKICQLLIPEKKNWNSSQLLCLLSWSNELFKLYYPEVIENIGVETDDSSKIAIILDIFSELCQFDISKNGFISYNIIEPIINLFGKIQQSIEPSNAIKPANDSKFSHPHVKSTIIEIISYLVHDNKTMQDKIRELHGLELVLSNCVIDDNNPFIKERAITCLKFLLANNDSNQQVIRNLEAQGTQENKILGITSEVGQ